MQVFEAAFIRLTARKFVHALGPGGARRGQAVRGRARLLGKLSPKFSSDKIACHDRRVYGDIEKSVSRSPALALRLTWARS